MKSHPEVKIWIGTVCGIRSYGFWANILLDRLYKRYEKQIQENSLHITNITYGYLWATLSWLPWVKKLVLEYLASRLSTICLKYPLSRKIILLHSYSSWAVPNAILRFPGINLDTIIFFGAVLDIDFDWDPIIEEGRVKEVINFVGKRDWVISMAKLFGFGTAGRYGFSQLANGRVKNIYKDWYHNSFIEAINSGEIEKIIDEKIH